MFLDGTLEMMNIAHYISFASKPKNGSLDAQEATAKWEAEFTKPGSITDMDGPSQKLARRVAIKVKDTIIFRNATERSRILLAHLDTPHFGFCFCFRHRLYFFAKLMLRGGCGGLFDSFLSAPATPEHVLFRGRFRPPRTQGALGSISVMQHRQDSDISNS
jgi:hypothetical protein